MIYGRVEGTGPQMQQRLGQKKSAGQFHKDLRHGNCWCLPARSHELVETATVPVGTLLSTYLWRTHPLEVELRGHQKNTVPLTLNGAPPRNKSIGLCLSTVNIRLRTSLPLDCCGANITMLTVIMRYPSLLLACQSRKRVKRVG